MVKSRPNQQANRFDCSLLIVDVATRRSKEFLPATRGLESPSWSATGSRIAYLASDAAGKPQIFTLTIGTGATRQVAHNLLGVQQFVWRPGHGELIYSAFEPIAGSRQEGAGREAGNRNFPLSAPARNAHLWIVPADGGHPRRLTSGTWTVAQAFPPSLLLPPIAVSPDGQTVVYTKAAAPYSADIFQSSVQVLDLSYAQSRPLTTAKAFEMNRTFSPDGKMLEVWSSGGLRNLRSSQAATAPVAPDTEQSIAPAIDGDVQSAFWMPDSTSMLVASNDVDSVSLWL